MDIVQYTADRFPEAFAVFLKEQFPTRSISPTDLYTHNQTVEDAYEFHRREGYSTFYFLQTRRGQLHRNIYLAVRPFFFFFFFFFFTFIYIITSNLYFIAR